MASETKKNDLKIGTCIILLQVVELLINVNIYMVFLNVGENVTSSNCMVFPFPLLLNLLFYMFILLFKTWNKITKFAMKPLPIIIYQLFTSFVTNMQVLK